MSTATITGTIRLHGVGINTILRIWGPLGTTPTVEADGEVSSGSVTTVSTSANGGFTVVLSPGVYRVTYPVGSQINQLDLTIPDGGGTFTLDQVITGGAGGGGGGGGGTTTFTAYWGTSALAELAADQVPGLANSADLTSIQRTWDFPAAEGEFKYFAWPDSAGSPRADDGIKLGIFPAPMAGSDEGYTQTQNGWNYQLVTISGVTYRIYRTFYQIGGAVSFAVTK